MLDQAFDAESMFSNLRSVVTLIKIEERLIIAGLDEPSGQLRVRRFVIIAALADSPTMRAW